MKKENAPRADAADEISLVPTPWSQGRTLMTAQTLRWTSEQIDENNKRECRMVFANFSALDEGRGRVLVAVCEREEYASRLVACVNACAGVTDEMFANGWTATGHSNYCKRITSQRDDLLDLVALALPYIEEAEKDPAYKPGSVAKLTARMRAAVEGGAK